MAPRIPVDEHDIIFFRIPMCWKCRAVASHLRAMKEERPELKIVELSLLGNIGLARKLGLVTAPSLLIRGRPLKGLVSKEEIRATLDEEVIKG